jgi:hypothetical protein
MTVTSAGPTAPAARSGRVRTGLVLCILLGAANIPFLFSPTQDGDEGPPYAVLVVGALLGLVSIVGAIMFWRSGNRLANRLAAAALVINAITGLPAFFVDVSAGIKVVTAATTLLTVVAVVLMLGRPDRPRAGVTV